MRNCSTNSIKKIITKKDPLEQGVRKTLNFGHTFGHALESLFADTVNPFLHGEAVAWGIVFANFVSLKMKKQETKHFEKTNVELKSLKLLNNLDDILKEWDASKLLFYMQQDKKNNQQVQMVLYSKPGVLLNDQYTHPIDSQKLSEFVADFYKYLTDNKQGFS